MKKIHLFSFLLCSILSTAQIIPNASFESWETIGSGMNSYQEPINWNTLNGDLATYFVSADATKVNDSHSGLAAVKLETKSVAGINTPAVLTIGTVYSTGTFDRDIRGGIPYTQKPQVFEGWYKFTPQGNDKGYIACLLFKHNYTTHKQDTVGAAIFKPTATTTQYTKFSINFDYSNYMPSETPDSLNVIVTSSFKFSVTSANIGTTLFVDDLNISLTSDIENPINNACNIHYSSSKNIEIDRISTEITNIYVISILGETVINKKLSGNHLEINASSLTKGIYLVRINSSNEDIVSKIWVY